MPTLISIDGDAQAQNSRPSRRYSEDLENTTIFPRERPAAKPHTIKALYTSSPERLRHMTERNGSPAVGDRNQLMLSSRRRATDRDSVIATLTARMQLIADLTSPELFVHVAEGSASELTLAQLTGTTGTPLGWEGTIFPTNTWRRHIALPRGARLIRGLAEAQPKDLRDLDARVIATIQDPKNGPEDSFLLYVDDRLRGCLPVVRLNPTTVRFQVVIHDRALLADDARRRSFLRLAAWSTASDIHLEEGSTIITWMPDDGDPINEYKRQVAAPDWINHWVTYRVLPHHLIA
jgi:hypothetical protein